MFKLPLTKYVSILLLAFNFLAKEAKCQISYTYTFDSSVLSILLGSNEIMNSEKPVLRLDLHHKWKDRKNDSVTIHIRGFYGNNETDTTKRRPIALKCRVFKMKLVKEIAPDSLFITVQIPVQAVLKKPRIIFTSRTLRKRINDSITIDSIDMEGH